MIEYELSKPAPAPKEQIMSGAQPTPEAPLAENVIELPISEGGQRSNPSLLPREGKLWLAATLLLLVTGLFKGINLLVLLSYLTMGVWLVNWRLVGRDLKRIEGRRRTLGPIFAGTTAEFLVEIVCNDPRPARGLTVIERGASHEREWMILYIDSGRPERIRWRQVFPKRGRYTVQPLRAVSRFPFGLISRTFDLAPAEEWIILPRLGTVRAELFKQWLARNTRGDGRMRRRQLQPALQEADIHGLRDFRTGDSPRWIHWRSSARRNQLLVREFEDSSPPDLILIVEPWLPEKAAAEDFARLETIISLAASTCREWCRDAASRLTLVIGGEVPVIFGASSGTEFGLRALAVVEGHPATRALDWLDQLPRASPSTPVLILTSRSCSPLPDDVAGYIGRPTAVVHAADAVPWYDPPVHLAIP
jgi:uncharacterized protein (DUF58 family)